MTTTRSDMIPPSLRIGRLLGLRTGLLIILLMGAVSATTACGPSLYAASAPPPTKVAQMRSKQPFFGKRKHYARLSVGVALAVQCMGGSPCKRVQTSIAHPDIIKVVPAHLARLQQDPMNRDALPASTFLLVGMQPGQTMVRLDSDQGSTTIAVTVVESHQHIASKP